MLEESRIRLPGTTANCAMPTKVLKTILPPDVSTDAAFERSERARVNRAIEVLAANVGKGATLDAGISVPNPP